MRRRLLLFAIACFLIPLLDSCHSSRKEASSYSTSRQPKFINNVYIDPHAKTGATADAIDHNHKAVNKPKQHATKQQPSKPIANNTPPPPAETYKQPAPGKTQNASALQKKYATMLGMPPTQISNFSLYRFIDKWLGTDYRLGGQDNDGIDCSGFAQKLYGEVYGIDLLRTAIEQFANCKRFKDPKEANEGDLVFFHIRKNKRISHVGVYLGNNYFVHSSTSGGVIISNLDEEYWHKYYAGCGRVPRG